MDLPAGCLQPAPTASLPWRPLLLQRTGQALHLEWGGMCRLSWARLFQEGCLVGPLRLGPRSRQGVAQALAAALEQLRASRGRVLRCGGAGCLLGCLKEQPPLHPNRRPSFWRQVSMCVCLVEGRQPAFRRPPHPTRVCLCNLRESSTLLDKLPENTVACLAAAHTPSLSRACTLSLWEVSCGGLRRGLRGRHLGPPARSHAWEYPQPRQPSRKERPSDKLTAPRRYNCNPCGSL